MIIFAIVGLILYTFVSVWYFVRLIKIDLYLTQIAKGKPYEPYEPRWYEYVLILPAMGILFITVNTYELYHKFRFLTAKTKRP